ncbi:MAG: cob(I)yrinic acid a,c-diamide adenosyltransferase [Promethearchaeota archaeon]
MGKPIFTRSGDTGETHLLTGEKVDKISPRVEAYGTLDELSVSLGVAKTFASEYLKPYIQAIQEQLYFITSEMAALDLKKVFRKTTSEDVLKIENLIEEFSEKLPPVEHFVIPGGTKAAAFLHMARAICRRAERRAIRLARKETLNPEILKYLNRLSDYLFVLGRYANLVDGDGDLLISREGTFRQKLEKK